MHILRTVEDLRAWRRTQREAGQRVGFVPTMGYLHDGHLSLCRAAKAAVDQVVVSIFVNPLQFGPTEDLDRYPRDEAGDLKRLDSVGVDAVFLPSVDTMYPPGFATSVEVEGLTAPLCGRSRPVMFKGVTTVVTRLFNLVSPQAAFMGLKDYQQYRVICKLVSDLGMDLEVVGVPTVREADGLAMSSRNVYLKPDERVAARVLSRALQLADDAYQGGERNPEALRQILLNELAAEPLAVLDYAEVLDALTLEAAHPDRPMVAALAVKFGATRLIDNRELRR